MLGCTAKTPFNLLAGTIGMCQVSCVFPFLPPVLVLHQRPQLAMPFKHSEHMWQYCSGFLNQMGIC